MKLPSSSLMSVMFAVSVPPSCAVPVKASVPVASSSTLATVATALVKSVVPPKPSVVVAVRRTSLPT